MSTLPEVGDQAWVKDCCGCPGSSHTIGIIVTVIEIRPKVLATCRYCKRFIGSVDGVVAAGNYGFVRSWLRKLPPRTLRSETDEFTINLVDLWVAQGDATRNITGEKVQQALEINI